MNDKWHWVTGPIFAFKVQEYYAGAPGLTILVEVYLFKDITLPEDSDPVVKAGAPVQLRITFQGRCDSDARIVAEDWINWTHNQCVERVSQGPLTASGVGNPSRRRSDAAAPPRSVANLRQEGGDHYKQAMIEPWDYIVANGLGFLEGNAVKYLTRFRSKGGVEDLKKARHYLDKLIEVEEKQDENR
jgi:hypothetical protein